MSRLATLALALGLLATACQESDDDRRAAYCDLVEEKADELTRTVDEGGAGAFVELLPTLEELGDAAPIDLKDEWREFLDPLRALRDVLEETGVEPDEVDGELPEELTREERLRVRNTAALLATPEVFGAVQGIEQHALDVCHTSIL